MVEVPGTDKDKGVTYDKTIYKIDPEVVKDEGKSHNVLDIKYTYYKVKSVSVTKVKMTALAQERQKQNQQPSQKLKAKTLLSLRLLVVQLSPTSTLRTPPAVLGLPRRLRSLRVAR